MQLVDCLHKSTGVQLEGFLTSGDRIGSRELGFCTHSRRRATRRRVMGNTSEQAIAPTEAPLSSPFPLLGSSQNCRSAGGC